jgi:O-antigen/teichoic acid export membrane protein
MGNENQTSGSEQAQNRHANHNIIIGTILGYFSLALSIVSGLLFVPWLISSIGKSNYGIYSLSNSLIAMFLVDFGFGATVNTFLAKYRAEGKKEEINNLLGLIYKLFFILDLVILLAFLVVYLLIDQIYVGLTVDERTSFKLVFLITACYSVFAFPTTIFSGVLSSYEEYIPIKILDVLNKLLYVGFTSLALVEGYGLLALVIVNVSSGLICSFLKFLVMKKKTDVRANFSYHANKNEVFSVVRFSLFSALVSIFSRLVLAITPNILGIVSDSTNISIFSVASVFENYVYLFGSVLGGFFIPKVTRILSRSASSVEGLSNLAVKVGKIQAVVLLLVVAGFICCGQEFIQLWMRGDSSFSSAYLGAILLMLYQLIFIPEQVINSAMYTQKHVDHLAMSEGITALINLGLCFLLGYYFGALGACISIAVARTIELLINNIYYKKDLGIDPVWFLFFVYRRPIVSFLITLAIGLLLHFYLPFSKTVNFLIEVFSLSVLYTVLTFFVSYSKKECKELFSLFRRNAKNG